MASNAPHSEPQIIGASGDSATLLYRPALWLLYASLISLYLILRFVVFAGRWPNQQDLQIEIVWAAIATLMLIVSSVALVLAQRAERAQCVQTARRWLLLTWLLGISFAIFEVGEYRHRWSHELIPFPIGNRLHDRADLYYLSAVQQRLMQLATAINTDKIQQNRLTEQLQSLPVGRRNDRPRLAAELGRFQAGEAQRIERLAVVNRLITSESKWISFVVATTDDLALQRKAIASLAYDIQPHRAFEGTGKQFRQLESQRIEQTLITAKEGLLAAEKTAKGNSASVKLLLTAVAEIKAEQKQLQTQLDSHLRQILADEELEDTLERSGDPKRVFIESQLAEVQQRLDERNAQLTDAATLVTEAEDSASQLAQEIGNIAARQALIEEIDKAGHGLNRQYAWLQLPVCIPGGTAWSWTYFALTILHAAHLACVLIAVSVIASVPRRWNWGGWLNLEPVGQNWHCMVSVWVILFVLFYLI